jgi:beta-glucosidase
MWLHLIWRSAASSIFDQHYGRASALAEQMTWEQKFGQMIQADFNLVTRANKTDAALAQEYLLGSLLVGGDGVPDKDGNLIDVDVSYYNEVKAYLNATQANWRALASKFGEGLLLRLKNGSSVRVKYLLGTDAVHGNQHVLGSRLWPHNLGLSNTRDPQVFEDLGRFTGQSILASGFNYAFAPTVALTHNPQWGRTYETMGSDPALVEQFAEAYVRGLQDVGSGSIRGVLASAKHFIGDGATLYGADEGSARVHNYTTFFARNAAGYRGAIKAEVGNVMCSYSAVNGIQNSIDHSGLEGMLRDRLGFRGFVISDYD